MAESVARDAARAATVEKWSQAWERAGDVVRAEAPGRLACELTGMEPDPRGRRGPPEPQEPLKLTLRCRVPSLLQFGTQPVAMPTVIRTVQVPWEGY